MPSTERTTATNQKEATSVTFFPDCVQNSNSSVVLVLHQPENGVHLSTIIASLYFKLEVLGLKQFMTTISIVLKPTLFHSNHFTSRNY
ncbi:hypothetical protein A0J61_11895 [Choanephora cucurbitarum]|uniref:Uncharacterized protein n=1 Tax=Choanephora cucurbitarum TaxID=101091 RepID=A0A1C7M0Q0_9FUNG|nr:hypothetical protein A0J61_11895 [Choanephora cucurbitarum]